MIVLKRICLSRSITLLGSLRWIARKQPYFPKGRLDENTGRQRLYGCFMLVSCDMPVHFLSLITNILQLIPVTTFGLGCWQVSRRRWKIDVIKKLKERVKREPVPLPQDLRQLNEMDYCPIRVTGEFDHNKEIIIENRRRGDPNLLRMGKSKERESVPDMGVQIVTPFRFKILVNRGWVPMSKMEPETRKEGQLVGINRLSEKKPWLGMENKPFQGHWYYRNVEMMARFLDTAPVYLEETIESSVPGGPIGSQTNVLLFNQHLAYIITWYAFRRKLVANSGKYGMT
ncbi:unnamed protein product [Soboliphyme baturini]|uniref:SURF1-like protein n=1 Tax=Soboliphyme baturini TaxID=241478 RepID=A0A183IJR5_9BILA|nr:unnamed protein product [Soboliphyme baturini]